MSFGADLTALATGVDGAKALVAGFGLAIVGMGVASIKAAGDFQSSMTSLVTGAGESSKNINMVSQGILDLANTTGESTKQLSDGMYMIESAGYHGAAGLSVLTAASEGARVGNANLADVANGVTTAMTDYASSNLTAAQATNDLIATVAAGKTHMGDLAQSFASILPTSAALHVGFEDVSAAMATMTGEGVPAANAATYLRQTLMALENPAKAGAKALSSIGLTSQEVSDEMKVSLPGALQMITDALAKKFPVGSQAYMQALKDIAGGSKQMQGMLDLTGQHLSVFEQNVKNITGAVQKGGTSIQGWALVQQDFNFKLDQAREAVETLGITLGTRLLPLLAPIIGQVSTLIGQFTAWASSGHAVADALSLNGKYAQIALPILAGVGALVLGVIVPAFWAWASATIAATWPLLLIAAAVAAAVAVLIRLNNTFPPVHAALVSIGSDFVAFGTLVGGVFDAFNRKAQESTLQAKLSTINNTITQKQSLIREYEDQKSAIEMEMEKTTSSVVRLALEAKIKAINAAQQQAEGVIASAEKQRQGVQKQLEQTDPVVAMHALKQKETSVSQSLVQAQQTVSNLTRQRQGIEQELQGCTDATKRHSLEMQLAATDAALKQKDGVVKALEGQKQSIEKLMKDQQSIVQRDSGGNALIQAWQGIQQAIGKVGAFLHAYVLPILQEIGTFLASTFQPVWKQLVDLWTGQLLPTFKQLWDALQPLAPFFQIIAQVVGGILLVALGLLVGIITGAARAIGQFVSGIATAIGGIIQFITGIVQVISGIVGFITDLLTGHFEKLGGDLGRIWLGIQNMFAGVWHFIQGIFQSTIGAIVGFISGFVQGIIGFFQKLYDELVGHSIIPDMITGILQWIGSLPGKAIAFVVDLVTRFITWISTLKAQAELHFAELVLAIVLKIQGWVTSLVRLAETLRDQFISRVQSFVAGVKSFITNGFTAIVNLATSWGSSIINNFLAGLKNAWGAVTSWIGGALQWVKDHFPHSPVKMGPLVGSENWGANLIGNIADSLRKAAPTLQSSLQVALQPVGDALNTSSPSSAMFAASANSQPVIVHNHNHVYLDGHELTDIVGPRIVQRWLAEGPVRSIA